MQWADVLAIGLAQLEAAGADTAGAEGGARGVVKAALEALIEREYLRRDPADPHTLHYVP
jgi:hypothetical protein